MPLVNKLLSEMKGKKMVEVDSGAKMIVKLLKKTDANDQSFYIGKLQFNGTLDFRDNGLLFMIFVSEDGCEEMQIGVLDPKKKKKFWQGENLEKLGDRISLSLKPFIDKDGNTNFIGEAEGDVVIDMKQGAFFTIFTSIKSRAQLQIAPLRQQQVRPARKVSSTSSTRLKAVDVDYRYKKAQ